MRKDDYYVVEKVGLPAVYENLAEECTELAQAALKMARILRKENPTPKSQIDVEHDIDEEFNDVILIASLLKLRVDEEQMNRKLARWELRLS